MRKQALRRTTLLSLLGLKSTASAQESTSWGIPFSPDVPSTSALLESNPPLGSAATSTETLVPTPPASSLASDATHVTETTSASPVPSATGTPTSLSGSFSFTVSLPTPSQSPLTMSVPVSPSGTTSREPGSSSRTDSAATTSTASVSTPSASTSSASTSSAGTSSASTSSASTSSASSGGAAPTNYVRMGMTGVLAAAAGLFIV